EPRCDMCNGQRGYVVRIETLSAGSDDFEQIVRDARAMFGVNLLNGCDTLRREYAGVRLPFVQKCQQFHSKSTRSMKTPYAVCSTVGEIETVPMVPIKSVWRSRRFEVPCPEARISVLSMTSPRTRSVTVPLTRFARLTSRTVLPS